MICRDISQLAPLYLSGEIAHDQRDLFRTHLAQCSTCKEQIDRQISFDAQLRDALSSDLPDARAVERSVRERIVQQRRSRRTMVAAAAAILVASFFGYRTLRRDRLFSDAAQDHRVEVVEHQPRHWRIDPLEIGKLAERYDLPSASSITPAGYRLEHAKMCGIDGRPALHLVYTNGVQEFSIFVLKRTGASGNTVQSMSIGDQHLAVFQTPSLDVIATGGSSADCVQLVRIVSRAL